MRIALLVLLLSAASAAQASWTPPDKTEIVLFAVAQALATVDTLQSMDIRNRPGIHEMNPLLGEHPSNARFAATLGVTFLATTALWYGLPSPARNLVPLTMISIELPICAANHFVFGLRIHL